MDNDLEIIRDQVKRYLNGVVRPERLKQQLDEPGAFDHELWRGASEQGWPALSAPEDAGGLGLGWRGLCVLAEESGRKAVSLPLAANAVALYALQENGARDIVAGLEASLVSGERMVCLAFCEKGEAGIPRSPSLTVEGALLSGRRASASFAAVADYALVNANEAGAPGLFLVPLDQPAVVREKLPSLDNARAAAVLHFSGAQALRIEGQASPEDFLERISSLAALATAFEQIGGASACMEMARDYALERIAFGQAIGRFQAIKHKLADMYWRIEVARGCGLDALEGFENDNFIWPGLAAAARVGATEAYEFAARENIQTHGGLGLTREAMPQHYYRRSRALALELGSQAYWRDRLIRGVGYEHAGEGAQ